MCKPMASDGGFTVSAGRPPYAYGLWRSATGDNFVWLRYFQCI